MTIAVEEYRGDGKDWDEFVRGRKGWTHFHYFGWKRVITQVFNHACPYLVARDDSGAIAGVLPLVHVKSLLFGRYLMSMPFLNYGGPLGSDEAVKVLAARAVAMADERRAKLLELRSKVELPLDLPVSHRKITVVLDMPEAGPEALMSSFDRKLRGRIRRPQKEGVTVRFGLDQVDAFFEIFRHHMRDLGTPTLPRSLFATIATVFPDDFWMGIAWVDGKPAACGAGFRWENEYEMTWGSALRQYSSLSPNMLLYWSFMERAFAEKVTRFNFGRCSPGSGTHEFKRQWGSHDEALYWYDHARGAASTPSPDDSAYSWGPRLWKRLPVSIASAIGPALVRGLP